ncbi:RNA polymerase sigma factor [Nonomuraea aridisoli]|uniref:Sigma-70 family RNA polymerase sigma factor n=1 Tax=Nonomuraea aridisoli TaxID=2070368 RepID=A0A2W2EN28_9ACTN|nr:sigma-70 family RNA polymerase sigma factor [Nonomuraea aridisoli]PZG14990.1 sigma-70 family RNA polymerase sigma factor [Nonomuraea aridisoli]
MHLDTIERPAPPDVGRFDIAALVAAARDGDAGAWERLVEEFSPMLRARIRRFRLSHEDSQDVLQTTWLLAWQNLSSVTDGQRMAGWLATIAFRECLKLTRRTKEICTPDLDSLGSTDDVDRELARIWLAGTLAELVEELPQAQRVLFKALTETSEPHYVDVARRLGRPVGSIGPTRARCFARLRGLLQAREITRDFLD